MDEHGKIVLREGSVGPRPGLPGGPDVWEVIAVHRSFGDVQRTADWLDQPTGAIEAALRHYDGHREEIDEWGRRYGEAAEAGAPAAQPAPGGPRGPSPG